MVVEPQMGEFRYDTGFKIKYEKEGICQTLRAEPGSGKPVVIEPKIAAIRTRSTGKWEEKEKHYPNIEVNKDGISNTLSGVEKDNVVVIPVMSPGRNTNSNVRHFKTHNEPMFTLTSIDRHAIFDNVRIRRLTPIETERLQGFPDNYTKYGIINGKQVEISDSQRYKCCGNAVTVNVIKHIADKLKLF